MSQVIRTVTFRPFRSKSEPIFSLETYQSSPGIAYRLTMRQGKKSTVIFEGEDFMPSIMHAADSDETVRSLMSFLTMRFGDTDSEYFDNYNSVQLNFVERYAESLGACVECDLG